MHNPASLFLARLLMAACLLTAAAHAAAAQETTFRTYQDNAGFSCDFPSDWSFDQAKNSDRIFSGPAESALDATIIIQVIEREKAEGQTAALQLEALKAQLLQAPDGAILNEGTAPIAEQKAPYLIAGYTIAGSDGKPGPFRHIQMVVTAPQVFLLMSYSAPDATFDQNMRVFQNCSATLSLGAADPPAPNVAEDPGSSETGTAEPDAAPPGSEDTLIWRHNTDRNFWIAVPSIWSKTIDQSEPYSVDMQHPERVEGVIVFVVDMDTTGTVKEYADAWEQVLADQIFFMKDRLAVAQKNHPGVGLPKVPGIMRAYQGEINGATVRSIAAYVVTKNYGFTVVGYHFLGDHKGEKRIRDAVESFRLAAPDG